MYCQFRLFSLLIWIWFLAGCGGGGSSSPPSPPDPPVVPEPPTTTTELHSIEFARVTDAGFTRTLSGALTSLSDEEKFGGGVAAADFDADGDVDLYVVGRTDEPNHLYANRGDGTFEEVGGSVGLDMTHWGSGPAFGDIDGDGDLDLFIGAVERNPVYLFENKIDENAGRYVDITATSGISFTSRNIVSSLFYDYDRDGFLDLFVTHWGEEWQPGKDTETVWRNNGDRTFTNVSIESGIATAMIEGQVDWSFTPSFSDIDHDGDGDLLLASDFGESQIFRNNDDGTFTRITEREQIVDQSGMGSAIGDFDNDGDMDWFVTSIYNLDLRDGDSFGNRIYRNRGGGVFEDATFGSRVEDGAWGWATCAGDFDNDGFLDLVEVNGWTTAQGKNYRNRPIRFYYNLAIPGGMFFREMHEEVKLLNAGQGRALACFDSDHDGDLDILIVNASSDHIVYYRNETPTENNHLSIELAGTGANRLGIGARIEVTTPDRTLVRELGSANHFTSHNPFEVHFGLGSATLVDILVIWPDESTTRLNNVASNQRLKIQATQSNLRLVVAHGQGSGSYGLGERVTIRAGEPEEGYFFSHWSSDDSTVFENPYSAVTVVTMPNSTLSVRANFLPGVAPNVEVSAARRWMEVALQAIRNDYARPTVHARNLFHISAAMYDAWAATRSTEQPWLLGSIQANSTCDFAGLEGVEISESTTIEATSFAAYRIILERFQASPGASSIVRDANTLLEFLGFDAEITSMDYASNAGAHLGNYIADCYLDMGLQDGANEENDYANIAYVPSNPPLKPHEPGNPDIVDLNRWQPLSLLAFIDQAGNPADSEPDFLSPEWGSVWSFALQQEDLTIYPRDDFDYWVYHDPGHPPLIGGSGEDFYKWGFELVAHWSSHLDPADETTVDISPKSLGNIESYPQILELNEYKEFYDDLDGGDAGVGYDHNPKTGLEYEAQVVPRGDYTRVLAEFWADGPDSETPPGHWFVILNEVNDHPLLERRFEGSGPELDSLEWDIKAYFALGGAMHDSAITAWGIKGWYDYIRPISAIRAISDRGQSSDSNRPSFDAMGISLLNGFVELVAADDPLVGETAQHVGKVKVRSWKGPDFVSNPTSDIAGVGWILAENWWPYQRPSFVTPPFAGYVSGHSTYSRAAAEVLAALTGDVYFPGGMSSFEIPKDVFLKFEKGPSVDMTLQWATYYDASDQCSLSRIWGGIHPPADDIPGRLIGMEIGKDAFARAKQYFTNTVVAR